MITAINCAFAAMTAIILICIAVFDVKYRKITNKSLILLFVIKTARICILPDRLAVAVDSIGIFFIAVAALLIFGILNKRSGAEVGAGDYKYIAVLAYCLGVEYFLTAAVMALILLFAKLLLLTKRNERPKRLAAAPYWSAGAVASLGVMVLKSLSVV